MLYLSGGLSVKATNSFLECSFFEKKLETECPAGHLARC